MCSNDNKLSFVKVKVWCQQMTSCLPKQWWPISVTPYGVMECWLEHRSSRNRNGMNESSYLTRQWWDVIIYNCTNLKKNSVNKWAIGFALIDLLKRNCNHCCCLCLLGYHPIFFHTFNKVYNAWKYAWIQCITQLLVCGPSGSEVTYENRPYVNRSICNCTL